MSRWRCDCPPSVKKTAVWSVLRSYCATGNTRVMRRFLEYSSQNIGHAPPRAQSLIAVFFIPLPWPRLRCSECTG